MSFKLILAITAITLALVFYTIGVFSERKAKILKKNHVIIFYLGLICDTTGTFLMSQIAKTGVSGISQSAQMIHGITGTIAILLMLFHALWATWVLYKNDKEMSKDIERLSPDGFSYDDGEKGIAVEWRHQPHYYEQENMMVIYVGRNEKTLDTLEKILGSAFIGVME